MKTKNWYYRYEIHDGEHEYYGQGCCEAKTLQSAKRQAIKNSLYDDDYVIVEIYAIDVISKKDLEVLKKWGVV